MADNIQFRVDAVLGDTTRLQQQINNLKANLNININNTQALKAIGDIQRQFDKVKSVNGEIVELTEKVNSRYQEWTTTISKSGQLTETVKTNYAKLQSDIDNFHKKNLNGIDFEIQKREEASKRFSQQIKAQMEAEAQRQAQLNRLGVDTGSTLNTNSIQDIESLKTALQSANIGWDNNNSSIKQFSQHIDNAGNTITKFTTRHKAIENGVEVWKDTSYAISSADGKLRKYNESQQQVINSQMNLSTMLASAIERFAVWGIAMKVWTGLGNAISDCISYVEDLDSAMTNIRVVTMDTKEATQALLDTYNQMAQDLGANTTDIAEGAVDWLRQGFSEADTAELVKDSTVLSKLALIDNAQATEYLTSALKGYKLEAKDAMDVIDQLTAIDLEAATSAGDMAEAMSRTANMANTTGFEMNELLGVIATVSEVTQNSASTIGNSVKTLLSRMSNVKAGVEIDPESGEALNDVEKVLNRVGIALRDNQGNWLDFYDILDEIASRWGEFNDIQQSQITTALGGTRQRENVLVMLENWDLVKKYAETGANSAGTAMEKYGIILESVEAKQAQLTAKVQEFYTNILNSGVIAGLLDIGKALMDVANVGDSAIGKIVLLNLAMIALNVTLNALKGSKIATWFTTLGTTLTGLTTKTITLSGALQALNINPIILGITALITALIAGKAIFDHFNVTLEEQHTKAQQAKADYEEIATELETVNSELKTTQERIDELNSKDKLSVSDKEELERLKKTNAELEKRQYWLDLEAQRKKAEATTEAKNAWDKDFNQKDEYVSRYETQPKWNMWSQQWQDQGKSISETEHIQEYIRWYGELQKEIDNLVAKEGEWTEEENNRYNALTTQLSGVKSYLEETGAKIQTDFLDTYDVDDETKNSWIELRDKIADALGVTYDTADAMGDAENAGSKLAVTFDGAFSDYANEIQALSEQYEILTKAQEEYNEYGNITASTMQKIIDNGLLDYLVTENGQLQFNTQALQENANATRNNAIQKLQEALFTDLQSIALGTYQDTVNSTDTSTANTQLQNFQTELSKTTGEALTTAGAIATLNASLGTDYQFSKNQKEQADAVVANYNAMVSKVNAISANLSTGTYRSGSSSGSKSTKEWWETQLETLKDDLDYNAITLDTYIKGLENLLGKVSKGSEAWKEINKELQKAKLDNIENQFERGEITIDQYISKLTDLRKNYKKNTEGYKELTQQINEAKADKFADQYERSEISLNSYIKQLTNLRNSYTKNSEEWKKYNDLIKKTKLDALEEQLDKINNQYKRGEITTDRYIEKLVELRKSYKKNSEEYKELTKTINDAKADKFADQYKRGEISLNTYIKKLKVLRDSYKKNSEEWKKYNDLIKETKLNNLNQQFENGEITIGSYIKGLEKLRNTYKKNSEEYKNLDKQIKDIKADAYADQYQRGTISLKIYITKLRELRNSYKKNSEEWKKYNDLIRQTKLEAYFDKLTEAVEKYERAISRLGNINTDAERVEYAKLLSKEYKQIIANINSLSTKLDSSTLTEEERNKIQEELNALLQQEVNIRDQIESSVREYYENQREEAEKQAEVTKKQILYEKELELYGEKGKELWEYENNQRINGLQQQLDLRIAEKEALDDINEREELENNLLEARLKLQNALNSKTTKILTKQADGTWAYTFSANMADVKSANDEVNSAQKALDDFNWQQETKRLEEEIEQLNANAENLANQYQDAEFWANRAYEQTMNSIALAYGDIDGLVEQWMQANGTTPTVLTQSYQSLVASNNTLNSSIVALTQKLNGEYEAIGNNGTIQPQSFDTGGEIVGSGLAWVHDKERVLTPQQNLSYIGLLDNIESINKLIDVSKFSLQNYQPLSNSGINSNPSQTVINSVSCNFPSITTPDGLQKAILELPRLALQKKQ